jgi:hypothetical protein
VVIGLGDGEGWHPHSGRSRAPVAGSAPASGRVPLARSASRAARDPPAGLPAMGRAAAAWRAAARGRVSAAGLVPATGRRPVARTACAAGAACACGALRAAPAEVMMRTAASPAMAPAGRIQAARSLPNSGGQARGRPVSDSRLDAIPRATR